MPRRKKRHVKKRNGRPPVVRVVTRRVLCRAHSFEEALEKAEAKVKFLTKWDKVEVCYWPAVDVPHSVKGPWTVEAVNAGGPNGEGLAPPKDDEDNSDQLD